MRILLCAWLGLTLLGNCAHYDATSAWLGLSIFRPIAPWWNRSWGLRRSVTIANHGTTLSDVPVLIPLSSSNFSYANAQSNGMDVCFADSSQTQLAFERDVYNTAGNSAFWIRIPTLPSGSTTVYMYYNSQSTCPSTGSVWDSNFRAVYHLSSDPSASVPDSANSNALTGIAMTAANLTSTQTGYGFLLDGTTQYLTAPDSPTLQIASSLSLEVVYKLSSYTLNAHYLVEKGDSDFDNYSLYLKRTGAFGCTSPIGCAAFEFRDAGSSYFDITGAKDMTTGTWHTLAANVDATGGTVDFYLDGSFSESLPASLPGNMWPQVLSIGRQSFGASSFLFSGTMDEVRISSALRSADYFAFVHDNVTAGSTPTIGAEETQPF